MWARLCVDVAADGTVKGGSWELRDERGEVCSLRTVLVDVSEDIHEALMEVQRSFIRSVGQQQTLAL